MNKTAFGRFRVAVLLSSSLLFSCGPSGGSISITSFSATPNPAFQQESATLSWQISGASSASISPGVGEVNASSGSVQVSPNENTSYVLTAKGTGGSTSKTVALTVQPFGRPQITDASGSPLSGLIAGEAKDVVFSLYVKVPASGSVQVKAKRGASELTELLDNGSLQNGDEIGGDGIYSGKVKLNEANPGEVKVDLSITLAGQVLGTSLTFPAVKGLKPGEVGQQINTVQQGIKNKLDTLPSSTSLDDLVKAAADYLSANTATLKLASVESGPGLIELRFSSGLHHSIRFDDEQPSAERGPILGGSLERSPPDREAIPTIPLEQQTRGETIAPLFRNQPTAENPEFVGGRSVLIYSAFTFQFGTGLEEGTVSNDGVIKMMKEAKDGFNVTWLKDSAANVTALQSLTNYDYIIFFTHAEDGWMATGESVKDDNRYLIELGLSADGSAIDPTRPVQMGTYSLVLHSKSSGKVLFQNSFYKVNDLWFKNHLTGRFNKSIVVAVSCSTLKSDKLWNAFSAKGAGAYFGWTASVQAISGIIRARRLTENLLAGRTTGESFEPYDDPLPVPTRWEVRGNQNLKFPLGLVNGGFEGTGEFANQNRLQGWKPVGDGRPLFRIGAPPQTQLPSEGGSMAILSTGLGFTTTSGSIEQSFYVDPNQSKLKFSWNFLSEEFLEYIGSSFQDAFKVTIVQGDTNASQDPLNLSINAVAAKFGASKCFSPSEPCASEGGSLKKGSPQLVFDKSDVWYTGWQEGEIDLTPYREKGITLRFSATDVGDSSYDTAVLVDNVRVE